MFSKFFTKWNTPKNQEPQQIQDNIEVHIPEIVVNFQSLDVVSISFFNGRYILIHHIQESYDGTSNVISTHSIEIQHPSQYDEVITQYNKYIEDKNAADNNNIQPEK